MKSLILNIGQSESSNLDNLRYSGIFESITRPPCIFADIEIIEKIRHKRHIFKSRRDKLITTIKNL